MVERNVIAQELAAIEQSLKELEIRYEQYFAGIEKREPMKDRENLGGRLRRFANRRINQTDLRFKYQTLATRFHSYAGYWDRILRLMEEGKFNRQTSRAASTPGKAAAGAQGNPPLEVLHRELLAAHRDCKIEEKAPDLSQVAAFLQQQQEKIREKFGDRAVEFRVVTEDGKPKIKVRAKKAGG